MVGVTLDPDELYALPREEFTAARRELARRVRADGDPHTAAAIEKLPKPTTAAWMVNQVVRRHPDAVAGLVALAADLRAAHEQADGPRLRELTKRRGEVVRELVALAGHGEPVSESITRELEGMFTAAVVDESSAERLRTGCLASVRDLSGAAAWPGLAMAPAAPRTVPPPAPKPRPRTRREAIRKAMAEAKAAVKSAEAERAQADRLCADAESRVAAAEERVRELNAQLDEAEAVELEARRTLQMARRAAKEAERAAATAWRRLQQVEEAAEED